MGARQSRLGWPGRVRSTGRVAQRQEAAQSGFNSRLTRLSAHLDLIIREFPAACQSANRRPTTRRRPRSAAVLVARVAKQLEDRALQRREFGHHHRGLLTVCGQRVTLHIVEDIEHAGGRGMLAGPPFRV